jgi:hypothetical protein
MRIKGVAAAQARRRRSSDLELALSLQAVREKNPERFQKTYTDAGIGRRTAYALAKVAKRLQPFMEKYRDQMEEIGWTKLEIIADHLTKENARERLGEAKTNTVPQLKVLFRDGSPPAKASAPELRVVQLYFTQEDYEKFASAILDHGGERTGRGLRNQEQALLTIIDKVGASPTPRKPIKPL